MAKTPPNHGKEWKTSDVKQLRALAAENTPTRVIGIKVGRTPEAVLPASKFSSTSGKPSSRYGC